MAKIVNAHVQGDFLKTENFIQRVIGHSYRNKLDHYGELGVQYLKNATPRETGKTANSWNYEIVNEDGRLALYWRNENVQKGVNIAVILQYGHATATGGFVEGIDYINPALRPVFEKIADEAWKEVIG